MPLQRWYDMGTRILPRTIRNPRKLGRKLRNDRCAALITFPYCSASREIDHACRACSCSLPSAGRSIGCKMSIALQKLSHDRALASADGCLHPSWKLTRIHISESDLHG